MKKFGLNTGRSFLIGEHPWSAIAEAATSHKRLAVLANRPTRMFFDNVEGLRELAIESTLPLDGKPLELHHPISDYPTSVHYEDYLYSYASLRHVEEVAPCVRSGVIIGLMFTYADRTQSTVGQVRLDCMGTPFITDLTSSMWLLVSRSTVGYPRVMEVRMTCPEDPRYFEVRWTGVLEWWFTSQQCKLSYEDRTTMDTL